MTWLSKVVYGAFGGRRMSRIDRPSALSTS